MNMKKTAGFILFFLICIYSASSVFEIDAGNGYVLSVEKGSDTVIHLILKRNGAVLDEHELQGAPDAMIRYFDLFERNGSRYVLALFDHGTMGVMTQIEINDLLIYRIGNNLELVEMINLKYIVYDNRTNTYHEYKSLSFFHDKNANRIILFTEVEGEVVPVETVVLR
jgi:hypothetical protein